MRLACAPNFRDLGGPLAAEGRRVRRGLVFRSEAVLDPGTDDAARLSAARIALVCDLRGAGERAHAPNRWWADCGIERIDLDIMADIRGSARAWGLLATEPGAAGGRSLMRAIYAEMPAAAAAHLRTVLGRIEAGDLPLLIHCTAGKDRTGFMSAMILHALGVAWTDIVADYLASAGQANPTVAAATRRLVLANAPGASEDAIAAILGVEPSYLEASVATIRERHGSLDAYLKAVAGLTPERRERLWERLLTPT